MWTWGNKAKPEPRLRLEQNLSSVVMPGTRETLGTPGNLVFRIFMEETPDHSSYRNKGETMETDGNPMETYGPVAYQP